MKKMELRKVKRGDMFKKTRDHAVIWKKGHYVPASKSFSIIDVADGNRERFMKANTVVWTGFDY